MKKQIGKVEYDTEKSQIVKKVTYGCFGDANGYEETLYKTEKDNFFLYVNGGCDSIHDKEDIVRLSKAKATEWIEQH